MLRAVAKVLPGALRDMLCSRAALMAENTLLCQQVVILQRAKPQHRQYAAAA